MTVFEPIDASSTYEQTIARLGTAIRIGVLPPASKLPPERELAEQLSISRSTLRQALATLTASGHLTAVRGRLGGTFVAEEPPIVAGPRTPRESWRDLLDNRIALELGTAQLAAERATGSDAEMLAYAHDRLGDPHDRTFAEFRRADIAFHLALAECTGSSLIVGRMTLLQDALSQLLLELGEAQGGPDLDAARERVAAEHLHVLEAVRAGDAQRAVAEMRVHLATTENLLSTPA